MKKLLQEILKIVEEDNFLITSHTRPDGDAVAGQLAFAYFLKKLGKNYKIINEDPLPSLYSFLPLSNEFSVFPSKIGRFRVGIVLDCHEVSRLGKALGPILNACSFTVVVDHHPGVSEFKGVSFLSSKASSTCELLYEIISSSSIELDHNLATCLYTGIFTDTGGFVYTNTTSKTHIVVAHLLKYGVDVESVWKSLNRIENPNFIKLISLVLGTLKIEKSAIAHITMTKRMEKRCNLKDPSIEGEFFLHHIRPLRRAKVFVLFRELENGKVKVSMRGSPSLDMNKIARRLGGGGHPQAAGCILSASLEDAKRKTIEEIVKWLQ
jgi:phosphoesterase RecJ-like protein